jgi:DNA-binding CsgD family transcriptional regulator
MNSYAEIDSSNVTVMMNKYDTYADKSINNIYDNIRSATPPTAPATIQLAKRQYEINQWTSSNMMDTLFVFQLMFIGISIAAIMTSLYRMGIVNGSTYAIFIAVILLAIVFTIVRRAQYTRYTRDQRFWNRRQFDRAPAPPVKINIPTCSGISDTITNIADSEKEVSASLRKMFGR